MTELMPSDDKLEALLSRLDPKTRKRFLSASNTHKHILPTASLSINDMIGGGIPKGAITTVFGNYSSSKTSAFLESIGRWQKSGYVCAFVDAEGTYDKEWAARLGVNNDELLLINKKSFGAITDEIIPLLEAEIDVIVIDSITSALPEVFLEDDGTIKEFDKQKQIGAHARSCGIMTNALHYVNKSTAIVYLSQTRTDMSGMHPMQKPSGGKVVEFGSSIMIKLASSPQEKQQIKGKIAVGDKIHELPIGRPVEFTVVKNKVGPPGGAGSYNFYYSGDKVGIDNVDELVTIGKFYGAIRAGGAWTFFGEDKWQGQPAFVEALKNDKDLFNAVEKEVHLIKTGEIVE